MREECGSGPDRPHLANPLPAAKCHLIVVETQFCGFYSSFYRFNVGHWTDCLALGRMNETLGWYFPVFSQARQAADVTAVMLALLTAAEVDLCCQAVTAGRH